MSRRRILSALVAVLVLFVVAGAAVPFLASLRPSIAAKNNRETPIPLNAIPSDSFKEFEWNGWKVFLKRSPQVVGFLMPFQDGTYWLPDLTWERAAVPCSTFRFEAGHFQCLDTNLEPWWRNNARWGENGVSQNRYFPPLQTPPFVVQGNEVILGRTANDR